jgi:hypothetical protein
MELLWSLYQGAGPIPEDAQTQGAAALVVLDGFEHVVVTGDIESVLLEAPDLHVLRAVANDSASPVSRSGCYPAVGRGSLGSTVVKRTLYRLVP